MTSNSIIILHTTLHNYILCWLDNLPHSTFICIPNKLPTNYVIPNNKLKDLWQLTLTLRMSGVHRKLEDSKQLTWTQHMPSANWDPRLDPRTRNCYLWDQMLSSNPISSPFGELMGLWPMLLPNLTQNKEVFLPSNPRGKNLRFWD